MRMKGTNRGITLIVLIITIVILLILTAVSINVIISGDIFNSAKDTVRKTNSKVEQTQSRVDELLGEWESLNTEMGDNTGGENINLGSNTPLETHTHTWGNWEQITTVTCAENQKRICSTCGDMEVKPVPAGDGHSSDCGVCSNCGDNVHLMSFSCITANGCFLYECSAACGRSIYSSSYFGDSYWVIDAKSLLS